MARLLAGERGGGGAFELGRCAVHAVEVDAVWAAPENGHHVVELFQLAMVAVLMVSSLLSLAYLLPIPLKAFFGTAPDHKSGSIKEAPLPMLVATGVTSLLCIALFFFPDLPFNLLEQVVQR